MISSSFKFREFIPASKQATVDNVPQISGEEIGSFYEALTKDSEDLNSTTERKFKSSSARRTSTVPHATSKSSSDSLKQAQVSVGFLFRCAQNGDVAGLRQCFQEGLQIDARDSYGWTALMCAASSGATTSVKFLIDHGADRKVFDKSGMTPLRLARIGGHLEILKLLLDSHPQSTTSTVKVKLEKSEPVSSLPVSDSKREHYCELCKMAIRGVTLEKHFSSTVHQFAGHKANKFACSTRYHIPESNVGFQIMVKEGWNRNNGLGPSGSGMKYPPKTVLKRGRDGLGSSLKLKARITHFGPRDVNAVKYQKLSKAPAQTGISKRERWEKERTDKLKEIEFRRMWYSQD